MVPEDLETDVTKNDSKDDILEPNVHLQTNETVVPEYVDDTEKLGVPMPQNIDFSQLKRLLVIRQKKVTKKYYTVEERNAKRKTQKNSRKRNRRKK